jgi:regulator of protease activity HflC (stomatin/prohibitin superfamily)
MNSGKFIGVGILGFLFIMLFMGSYATVPPGHRGISVTLGKVSPQALGEGFTFKKPFIETIVKYPIMQITQKGKAASFSSDLQTIHVDYAIMYKTPEAKVVEIYQQYAGDPYAALIEPRLQEAIKQVTALFKAEELVKNREKIKATVLEKTKKEMVGLLTIVDFAITNIDLTDQLEKAIEDKQVKEQQALAKVYELQKAQKDAEIRIVNAKAEAEAIKITGDALAAAPKLIELELVKKWDGKAPQSVVTSQGGANILLPLTK